MVYAGASLPAPRPADTAPSRKCRTSLTRAWMAKYVRSSWAGRGCTAVSSSRGSEVIACLLLRGLSLGLAPTEKRCARRCKVLRQMWLALAQAWAGPSQMWSRLNGDDRCGQVMCRCGQMRLGRSCADVARVLDPAPEYQAAVLQNRPVGQHEKRQRVRGRDGIGRLLNAVFFPLRSVGIPIPLMSLRHSHSHGT